MQHYESNGSFCKMQVLLLIVSFQNKCICWKLVDELNEFEATYD